MTYKRRVFTKDVSYDTAASNEHLYFDLFTPDELLVCIGTYVQSIHVYNLYIYIY